MLLYSLPFAQLFATFFLTSLTILPSVTATGSSVPCGKGTYKTGSTCYYCPPGTWNDQPSPASSCTTAQTGHYACGGQTVNGQGCYGAQSQSDCKAGNYQPNTGKSSCITCPAGSICPSNNQPNPQPCSPGEYMPTTGSGANTCPGCPVGTFNNINGASACCECCAGTYNDQTHQTHCFDCSQHTNPHAPYSSPGATSSGQCKVNPIAGITNAPSCADSQNNMGKDFCPPTTGGGGTNPSPINKKRTLRCSRGYKRCPLYTGLGGFDCVDTLNDAESCGGCLFVDGVDHELGPAGIDCTAIPDVSVVQCVKSHCVIRSCRKGYKKAQDGKSCDRMTTDIVVQTPRRRRYHVPHHSSKTGL